MNDRGELWTCLRFLNLIGETPLYCACKTGQTQIVQLLLEVKEFVDVDYQVPEHGGTALHGSESLLLD